MFGRGLVLDLISLWSRLTREEGGTSKKQVGMRKIKQAIQRVIEGVTDGPHDAR